MKTKSRIIAFYLPQFHPIPENDQWWGKGFTEWTNVGKAKRLFHGHAQPRVPADLGYYDLRIPEIMNDQYELCKYSGVEGFAFWHYWWAGKRLLEKPLEALLQSKSRNVKYCLSWANETWSGVWHGKPNHILMEQTYPGMEDIKNHFLAVLPYFCDERYIQVHGKPIFFIYRPMHIPNVSSFINCWNDLAIANGLNGVHFVGVTNHTKKEPDLIMQSGFNAVNTNRFGEACRAVAGKFGAYAKTIIQERLNGFILNKYDYSDVITRMYSPEDSQPHVYPTILPQWDNSPRSGRRSLIVTGSTPEKFQSHAQQVIGLLKNREFEDRIVLLKSWNEWAEGNYVEPDLLHGWGYLDALRTVNVLQQDSSEKI